MLYYIQALNVCVSLFCVDSILGSKCWVWATLIGLHPLAINNCSNHLLWNYPAKFNETRFFFLDFFLVFDFCRFCVIIRFFHTRHNGQWPLTSKDFLSQILSITFIYLMKLDKLVLLVTSTNHPTFVLYLDVIKLFVSVKFWKICITKKIHV